MPHLYRPDHRLPVRALFSDGSTLQSDLTAVLLVPSPEQPGYAQPAPTAPHDGCAGTFIAIDSAVRTVQQHIAPTVRRYRQSAPVMPDAVLTGI